MIQTGSNRSTAGKYIPEWKAPSFRLVYSKITGTKIKLAPHEVQSGFIGCEITGVLSGLLRQFELESLSGEPSFLVDGESETLVCFDDVSGCASLLLEECRLQASPPSHSFKPSLKPSSFKPSS